MTALARARRHLRRTPGSALGDAAGLAALCALVFASFTLPGLL
jgi:hypothetical protein